MQTYLKDYYLYGFNWRKAFGIKYMAENSGASQKHPRYNKINVKYGSNALAKS